MATTLHHNHFIISIVRLTTTIIMPPCCKVTAAKRLREGKQSENFYISPKFPGKLFCKSCEKTLDHSRKKTLDEHLGTTKHKTAKRFKTERNLQARRQVTLNDTNSAAELRTTITHDFIAVCAEADIPLNKAQKLVPFTFTIEIFKLSPCMFVNLGLCIMFRTCRRLCSVRPPVMSITGDYFSDALCVCT